MLIELSTIVCVESEDTANNNCYYYNNMIWHVLANICKSVDSENGLVPEWFPYNMCI